MCCVALFAIGLGWLLRSGVRLFARLSVAVVMAATAFSAAVVIAEHLAAHRGTTQHETMILSEIVSQPAFPGETEGRYRLASSYAPINHAAQD